MVFSSRNVAAVKQWEFRPVIGVAPPKPVPSLASITFIYDKASVPGFSASPILPAMRNAAPKHGDYLPPLPVSLPARLVRAADSTGVGTVVLLSAPKLHRRSMTAE